MPAASLEPDVHGALPEEPEIEDMEIDKLGLLQGVATFRRPGPMQPAWLLPWRTPLIEDFGQAPCVRVRRAPASEKGWITLRCQYEGYAGEDAPPETVEECELDCDTSPTAIQLHPRFLELCKIYAGKFDGDDFLGFAKKLLSGDGATSGGTGPDANRNPLFGTSEYLLPGQVWRRTRLAKVLPVDLRRYLGFIDTSHTQTSGQRPPVLEGRANWLKVKARARFRGNIWQIVEEWLASGPDGWNKHIYRPRS